MGFVTPIKVRPKPVTLGSYPEQSTSVPFRQPCPPSTRIEIRQYAPFGGRITLLTFYFPDGCFTIAGVPLVEVAFRCSHGRYPASGYIALNDTIHAEPVNIPVFFYEPLIVEIVNGDGVNLHTPSVSALIEREY